MKALGGFRDGLCEECFLARTEKIPAKKLAKAVHALMGTVPTRERTIEVKKILASK